MNKRIFITIFIALLACLGVPGVASAHVLKVDGHIGAVLHINPDDNPTTGNPTDYVMSFDDDTAKFSLPKCHCKVSIIENGQVIATNPLIGTSSEISEDHYNFKKPDVYDLRFSGVPKIAGAFQPFRLDYEVRVTNGQASTQSMPVLLWIGLGLGIGLILLAAYAMDYDSNEPAVTVINKEHQ